MDDNVLVAAEQFHILRTCRSNPFELFACIWDSTEKVEQKVARHYLHICLDEAIVRLGDVITPEERIQRLIVTSLNCRVHSRKGSLRIGNLQPKEHTHTMYDEDFAWRVRVTHAFTRGFLLRRHLLTIGIRFRSSKRFLESSGWENTVEMGRVKHVNSRNNSVVCVRTRQKIVWIHVIILWYTRERDEL